MNDYLVRLSTGSARDNLSQDGIKALELRIPSLSTQQKIATVLSSFDKRIENLRAQNRVLEHTAKTTQRNTLLPLLMTGQIEV
jgi:type I restriction enzyme S subunit